MYMTRTLQRTSAVLALENDAQRTETEGLPVKSLAGPIPVEGRALRSIHFRQDSATGLCKGYLWVLKWEGEIVRPLKVPVTGSDPTAWLENAIVNYVTT